MHPRKQQMMPGKAVCILRLHSHCSVFVMMHFRCIIFEQKWKENINFGPFTLIHTITDVELEISIFVCSPCPVLWNSLLSIGAFSKSSIFVHIDQVHFQRHVLYLCGYPLLIEQGQILKYNSISQFGSHLNSKRLANADKRNSLDQYFKTNEAAKLPWNQYSKLSFGAGEGRFLREGMCL